LILPIAALFYFAFEHQVAASPCVTLQYTSAFD